MRERYRRTINLSRKKLCSDVPIEPRCFKPNQVNSLRDRLRLRPCRARIVAVHWAVLAAYGAVLGATLWLQALDLRHLRRHGDEVPPELAAVIDAERLRRISAYTIDRSRAGLVQAIVHAAAAIAFLFGGLLGWYDGRVEAWTGSFVGGGVLFFLGLAWAEGLLGVPFSLYRNFLVEARHGFNTMTARTWVADLLKSLAIGSVLTTATVAGALALVAWSPSRWWLWVWSFFLAVGVFLMYVSPYVIEPLFFKFQPVTAAGLEERLRALMEAAGLRVSRVFQVDASRRSRHSNAYFTGIGRVKRIVLFDTLLGQMTHDEIAAVLAHEIGHWKRRHVLKRLVVTEAVALGGLLAAFYLLAWEDLPSLVGLGRGSFFARAVILGFLGSLVSFPFTPLGAWWSRRHEWEADRFAAALTGRPGDLAGALVKLARENLSNLHPHPLSAAFHHSHPPVVARVRALRRSEATLRSRPSSDEAPSAG
jgi:STE24 endopeptidase